MKLRAAAAATICLAIAFAAPDGARADEEDDIETLIAQIEACLGRISDPGEHPELCMGLHALPCMDAPEGQSSDGAIACLSEETKAWGRILTNEYSALLARLDEEPRNALRDAQKKWTTFTEANCAFPISLERGALSGPWAADCEMQATARRAMELRSYLGYLEY